MTLLMMVPFRSINLSVNVLNQLASEMLNCVGDLKEDCACGPFWSIPASTPFRTPTSIRIFSSPVSAFILSGYLYIICMLWGLSELGNSRT